MIHNSSVCEQYGGISKNKVECGSGVLVRMTMSRCLRGCVRTHNPFLPSRRPTQQTRLRPASSGPLSPGGRPRTSWCRRTCTADPESKTEMRIFTNGKHITCKRRGQLNRIHPGGQATNESREQTGVGMRCEPPWTQMHCPQTYKTKRQALAVHIVNHLLHALWTVRM